MQRTRARRKCALVLAAAAVATTTALGTTSATAARPLPKVVRADITLQCVSPLRVALRAEISLDRPLGSFADFSGVLSSNGQALGEMHQAVFWTGNEAVVTFSPLRSPQQDSFFEWSVTYPWGQRNPHVLGSGTVHLAAPACAPVIGIAALGTGRYAVIDATGVGTEFPSNNAIGWPSLFTGVAVGSVAGHSPYVTDRAGRVWSIDQTPTFGEVTKPLKSPVVAMAVTPTARGYWLVTSAGRLQSFGNARQHGSMAGRHLNHPIVAMMPTATNHGYWLVGSDGGVFTFGDARFHGSTGNIRLRRPIIAAASTPTGRGYWLVASDGGVFTFGDARFRGSAGNRQLTKPVVGIARTSNGRGYWLVTSDGKVFAFGDAPYDESRI